MGGWVCVSQPNCLTKRAELNMWSPSNWVSIINLGVCGNGYRFCQPRLQEIVWASKS